MTLFDNLPESQPRKAEPPAWFNTTAASPVVADQERRNARTQEGRIEAFFRGLPDGKALAPSQVHGFVGGRSPLTSIRRAITNLTERGVLERTDEKVTGPYGKAEYRWRLSVEQTEAEYYAELNRGYALDR